MLEPLHAGVEHPNLTWIFLTAILSFTLGTGFGVYVTERVRNRAEAPSSEGATEE